MAGSGPVRVFYSYSHSDEGRLADLQKHLAMLRRRGLIQEWFDQDIEAGDKWREEISRELEAADLIILLISSDFLDSDFCYEEEMTRALERSDTGEARVIAVMLRPVDGWEDTPFAKLQVVPTGGIPVAKWTDQDEALADVAAKIRRVVERLRSAGRAPSQVSIGLPTESPETRSPAMDASQPVLVSRQREIVTELVELLSRPDGAWVVLDADPQRNYYVQYLADEQSIWCEVVSNHWIQPQYALGAGQMARLAELGWNPPEENLPNWWWPATQANSPDEIADRTLRTLTSVYGIDLRDRLEFKRSW